MLIEFATNSLGRAARPSKHLAGVLDSIVILMVVSALVLSNTR